MKRDLFFLVCLDACYENLPLFFMGVRRTLLSTNRLSVSTHLTKALYLLMGVCRVWAATYTPYEQVHDEAFYNEAINSELMAHRPTLVDNYIEWRQDHHQSVSAARLVAFSALFADRLVS